MNQLDIEEEIAKRVPLLVERDKKKWKSLEKLRRRFVNDYTLSSIASLTKQEYVIGLGKQNLSFCYRIERELDSLGRILGSTAFKFGVYYGITKKDAHSKYRFAKRWGVSLDAAFEAVKSAMSDLLQAASQDDMARIRKNELSPLFKGKLLFLYYPEKYTPIYSEDHLRFFASELNLSGSLGHGVDIQRALAEYQDSWPQLKKESPVLYMRFLYDVFWYLRNGASTGGASVQLPLLEEATGGASFISEMPSLGFTSKKKATKINVSKKKMDWGRRKRTGDRGEVLVVELEKRRLIEAGRKDLADKIDHIAQRDDSAGFDISSFDKNGKQRPIEVKATESANLTQGFFISDNELQKAKTLPNYHVYVVFSALSSSPKILPLKKPDFTGKEFILHAASYRATPVPAKRNSRKVSQ